LEFKLDGTITGIGGGCLTPTGSGTTPGSKLMLWTCDDRPTQQWNH
jgi:hypothetical protein